MSSGSESEAESSSGESGSSSSGSGSGSGSGSESESSEGHQPRIGVSAIPSASASAPPPSKRARTAPAAAAGAAVAAPAAAGKTAATATTEAEVEEEEDFSDVTFESLGVVKPLADACTALGWTHPTPIQREALPPALTGRDIIGIAETGSGKTAAFALPVLQALLKAPQRLFAVVLAPTRELAFQINEQFEALGGTIDAKCAVIVGGIDMVSQAVVLARRPHIIIATPGRLVDHLEHTRGFSLANIKYLVLDEADRMLGLDFEEEINKLLAVIPRKRTTLLFSATMTQKVAKLQRASLVNPVKVAVNTKYATPGQLIQEYAFFPEKYKECYLAYIINESAGQTALIFCRTCNATQRVALTLRHLGFSAVCLSGRMTQPKRLGALNKFKSGQRNILVATDVASRGLDIPAVDIVLNYDLPPTGKDYVHRVGRTARAGRAGRAISFVTQYDVEQFQRIEALIEKKLPQCVRFLSFVTLPPLLSQRSAA